MIPEILNSYSMTLGYLRRLVADVPDELFTKSAGGAVNHPAWVIGHLIHSAQGIGGEIGSSPWLPPSWAEKFGTGSVPMNEGYPTKRALLDALADAERRLTERILELGESGMLQPLPDEKYRPIFPTVGHAVLHILTAHAAIHVGQITVWRQAVGLGPLKESFD
jgi:hypothetical protein